MPTQRLTNMTIENAKPPVRGRVTIWDTVIGDDMTLPGSFGLRVTDRGVKSWVAMCRVPGARPTGAKRQRFLTLGHYPSVSLAEARERAREILKIAGRGLDPVQAEKDEKARAASEKSVEEAVEEFIERYAKPNNRSWQEVGRVFRVNVLPVWKGRALASITGADVHELLDSLMDAGRPYMANRVLAHTRKFMRWCQERHYIDSAPTDNVSPPAKEVARDRVLDRQEIGRFWSGCDDMGWPFGPCFKLLLITGQRLGEVSGMEWDHLDLENTLWTLPKEGTKSARRHEVPLTPLAMEILQQLPRNGNFVLSTNGRSAISGFSKAKARLEKLSGIGDWRLHDLRRSAASGMAQLGVAPHIIEQVLNHQTGEISSLARVYNRHQYLPEKRQALQRWDQQLIRILEAA